jgi:dipeptidyl-peptidase-4
VRSDRSGWHHLYQFDVNQKTWTTLTEGEWEVRKIHVVDEAGEWIYFTATKDSPIGENLYRCKLDGSGLIRLTPERGYHRPRMNPKGTLFVDAWSSFEHPTRVKLCSADGTCVRMLDTNPVYAREEFRWGEASLLQIPGVDGFHYEARLVKPADFDPSRKYPVWFMTYAGPQAPSIQDAWGSQAHDQMLANLGLVVFHMDPRSASGKGSCWAWKAHRQLGVQELKDITEAIEWLKEKPYIDASRIGMSGHSYGGFMTAYALTHSRLFAAGIAGAPVTDWRFYDSIYTERYMDLPQNNRAGYAASSVIDAARDLHGRLLLLHGMMDDNVHLQNATRLMDELQKAGKQFEVMFYPEMLHGLYGDHYQKLLVDFIRRSLGLSPEPAKSPSDT